MCVLFYSKNKNRFVRHLLGKSGEFQAIRILPRNPSGKIRLQNPRRVLDLSN